MASKAREGRRGTVALPALSSDLSEDAIQALLDDRIQLEREESADPDSEFSQKKQIFAKKLDRAGYAEQLAHIDEMSSLDSLMYLGLPFTNVGKLRMRRRRRTRALMPGVKLPRVTGLYELNLFAVELEQRYRSAQATEERRARTSSEAPAKKVAGRDMLKRANSFVSMAKHVESVEHDRHTGSSVSEADREHDEAESAAANGSKSIKRRGFSKMWVDLVIAVSFFPVDWLARLAANDFLSDPGLMTAAYLEWSAALEELAVSGQLSTAGLPSPRAPRRTPATRAPVPLSPSLALPRPFLPSNATSARLRAQRVIRRSSLRRLWSSRPPLASTTLTPNTSAALKPTPQSTQARRPAV